MITKQKPIIKKRFSKRRNAVSESETNTIQKLQDLNDSIKIYSPIDDQIHTIKKSYINNPILLYNWIQPIRHTEC